MTVIAILNRFIRSFDKLDEVKVKDYFEKINEDSRLFI